MDAQGTQTKKTQMPYAATKLFGIINLAICLVVVGLIYILFQFNLLNKFELITLDIRYKLRGIRKPLPDIVHIDMDESSISHIGRWPWSREWHAGLITALSGYQKQEQGGTEAVTDETGTAPEKAQKDKKGSKVIAFDIFFSEPSPLIDFFLVESTRLARNVVYAMAFELQNGTTDIPNEQEEILSRFKLSETQIIGNKNEILHLAKPMPLLPELYKEAFDAGHVIILPDTDGSVRRAPTLIECRGSYYLHFGIEIALAYLGIDQRNIKVILGKYVDIGQGTKIPIDKKGFMLINWAAPWGLGFKHYPFWEVVASYQQILKGEKPIIPLEEFKDKICLIGLTAIGLIDIKPIPFQTSYPMAGLHANIVDMILQKKFIREIAPPINLLIVLLLTLPIGKIIPKLKPISGAGVTLGIIIAYSVVCYLFFSLMGIWINAIYPLASVAFSFVAVTLHTELANALERMRLFHLAVEDGLTKLFVVRHFKEVLDQQMAIAKRENRQLSMLISDIDHFKKFNDTYGHQAGDFVLKEVANIFKTSCRQFDLAARYGGEEFVIMLPDTNRDSAIEFAERLRKSIEQIVFEYNNIKLSVTISIGVAEYRGDHSITEFIKRSDEALYVAKETGRNKVCFG